MKREVSPQSIGNHARVQPSRIRCAHPVSFKLRESLPIAAYSFSRETTKGDTRGAGDGTSGGDLGAATGRSGTYFVAKIHVQSPQSRSHVNRTCQFSALGPLSVIRKRSEKKRNERTNESGVARFLQNSVRRGENPNSLIVVGEIRIEQLGRDAVRSNTADAVRAR